MGAHTRHITDFYVSGMRFWDGALVINELEAGKQLKLELEDNNPHDPNAVALLWGTTKIGYIPHDDNTLPAQLLRFGHNDVLECRILKVDKTADTWKQVRAGLYVIDKTA